MVERDRKWGSSGEVTVPVTEHAGHGERARRAADHSL